MALSNIPAIASITISSGGKLPSETLASVPGDRVGDQYARSEESATD